LARRRDLAYAHDTWSRKKSKEAVEQFARMAIEARQIADQVLHTVTIGDQPGLATHAANILFALEQKLGRTTIGLHMPGARRDEAADLVQAFNFGHEFTLGHGLQQGLTLIRRQGLQVVNPHQLMALAVEDGKTRLGV